MRKRGKTVFISTAIPYVNAAPHLGHAIEFIQADIIARYHRSLKDDVYFLSGTDDNALKNVLKAEEAGKDVASFVGANAEIFEKLLNKLEISNDGFIKTSSDPRHAPGAQKLWSSFKPEDVEKKTYQGLYCVGCEEFKTERDLVNGYCLEHPNVKPEMVKEENYFFKLGHYAKKIEKFIASDELRIVPEVRKNEVLAFIRSGLEDLSISRSAERAHGWGVPVADDPGQIQYVWVDALSNYITALGYAYDGEEFRKYWVESDERIHVIGKGISRFHAIYWPAFLLSADLPLPKTLFVHAYVTVGGQKMSKSLGNAIDPFAVIEEYGADAFRYFLARHVHPFEDSDFTMERFKKAYNADLVNGIGNLTARVMQMAVSNLDDPVELTGETQSEVDVGMHLEKFEFDRAIAAIWERIGHNDALITIKKPFSCIKSDDAQVKEEAVLILKKLVRELYAIAIDLEPFMPATSKTIIDAVIANKKPENLFPRKE